MTTPPPPEKLSFLVPQPNKMDEDNEEEQQQQQQTNWPMSTPCSTRCYEMSGGYLPSYKTHPFPLDPS